MISLKKVLRKNIVIIVILLILLVGVVYFNTREAFKINNDCNMNYCTGDFEVVKDASGGVIGCFKKCNKINSKASTAISDPLTCREMSGRKVTKTFSRNFNSFKKMNSLGNNGCHCTESYNGTVRRLRGKCVAYSNPKIVKPINEDRCKNTEKYSFFVSNELFTPDGSKFQQRKCYSCRASEKNPNSSHLNRYIDTELLKCVRELPIT